MTAKYIVADVMDGLASLETGSVDLVVTSPPFLALRSYLPADHELKGKEIGSEATPAEFIDTLLRVTAELRRVLAPHGSICVELGDTYAGSSLGWDNSTEMRSPTDHRREGTKPHPERAVWSVPRRDKSGVGWPLAKSRTLIPSLYQIALAYGFNPLTGIESPAGQWRIRNVVTWARPNPPVGALGDKWRPATSDLIVACTSGKRYWDDLATRKPHQRWPREPETGMRRDQMPEHWQGNDADRQHGELMNSGGNSSGAPLLDYWVIPPGGYTGSHYAVFPEELVVPCVQAMCPQKVCLTCGEPSRRIVDTSYERLSDGLPLQDEDEWRSGRGGIEKGLSNGKTPARSISETLGWTDCGHDNWRPGLVLDPFAGSGTTLAVATGHGHDAIGIDIDSRNAELARDRVGPFFFEMVDLEQTPA